MLDAFYQLATLAEVLADELEDQRTDSSLLACGGLCLLAARMGFTDTISSEVAARVARVLMRETERQKDKSGYLHTPFQWRDGVRTKIALRLARAYE